MLTCPRRCERRYPIQSMKHLESILLTILAALLGLAFVTACVVARALLVDYVL